MPAHVSLAIVAFGRRGRQGWPSAPASAASALTAPPTDRCLAAMENALLCRHQPATPFAHPAASSSPGTSADVATIKDGLVR